MYAIKVLLRPTGTLHREPLDAMSVRVRSEPQPGIAHVTLRPAPPHVMAMTFVEATDLLTAEGVARDAWEQWLKCGWLTGWTLVACTGDFYLGVSALGQSPEPDADW